MPQRARPQALGLLQALSAVGNVSAALISMGLGHLEEIGTIKSGWRWMFVVGAVPALLSLLVWRKLKEPEQWQTLRSSGAARRKLGSYGELFGNPQWKGTAVVALLLVAVILAIAFIPSNLPKL